MGFYDNALKKLFMIFSLTLDIRFLFFSLTRALLTWAIPAGPNRRAGRSVGGATTVWPLEIERKFLRNETNAQFGHTVIAPPPPLPSSQELCQSGAEERALFLALRKIATKT